MDAFHRHRDKTPAHIIYTKNKAVEVFHKIHKRCYVRVDWCQSWWPLPRSKISQGPGVRSECKVQRLTALVLLLCHVHVLVLNHTVSHCLALTKGSFYAFGPAHNWIAATHVMAISQHAIAIAISVSALAPSHPFQVSRDSLSLALTLTVTKPHLRLTQHNSNLGMIYNYILYNTIEYMYEQGCEVYTIDRLYFTALQ